jgi:hypothetical protein
MIARVVDGVNADSINSKLLEHLNVRRKRVGVKERVLSISSTAGLVRNTTDEEALVSSHESIAINSDLDMGQFWHNLSTGLTSLTGSRLPLWRFFTPANAPDTREAAAMAEVNPDFIVVFGTTARCL